MIQAIVFDYGNVLCRIDRAACNRALASHSRLEVEEVGRRVWGGAIEQDVETGRIDSREQFRRIKAAISADEAWTYECFAAEYMLAIQPCPEGEQALLGARELGLRCFILSNTSFLHARSIYSNEVFCTVPELHALSFKLGWMKPDPRCWTWVLDHAGLSAGDCLYVDDVSANCAAAEALGFRAIHYEIAGFDLVKTIRGKLSGCP